MKNNTTGNVKGRRRIFLLTALLLFGAAAVGAAVAVPMMTGTAASEAGMEDGWSDTDTEGGRTDTDIVSWFTADIDHDSNEELLVITDGGGDEELRLDTGERYGSFVKIYSDYELANQAPIPKGEPDYIFDLSEIKPLKVQAGDINGDGEMELAVCVYKTTKFHPVLAKRPFFYGMKEGKLEPVWLGSRLARPFDDYILADVDHDDIDEIVSIEFLEDGGQVFAVYDWKGFGFEVKAVTEKLAGQAAFLNHLHGKQGDIAVEVDGERYQLSLAGSTIELTRQ